MFSVQKEMSSIPKSLLKQNKHDGDDVIEQLHKDFYSKCYICGDNTFKDMRVEHFVPHKGDIELKYMWENLFLSCDYCNNKKGDYYNTSPDSMLLKATEDTIEIKIQHSIEDFLTKTIKLTALSDEKTVDRTISFLDLIYNNVGAQGAQKIKVGALKKNICDELYKFRKDIDEYKEAKEEENEHVEEIKKRIENHLSIKSRFFEFKLGIIEIDKLLKEYLINESFIQ